MTDQFKVEQMLECCESGKEDITHNHAEACIVLVAIGGEIECHLAGPNRLLLEMLRTAFVKYSMGEI